jgi:rod shape-determining protein MreC
MKQSRSVLRPQGNRSWLPLLLLVVGLLLLIFHEAGYLTPLENSFHYLLDPLQRITSNVFGGTSGLFQTARTVRELRTEVSELREEVNTLRIENARLREYEAESQQLRTMLNFVSEYPISTYLGAEIVEREGTEAFPEGDVIGVDPNPYLRYATINVGSQQGVEAGMPVVSGGPGLVGRVASAAPRTSKVQLLTDSDSAVAALLQTSRATGLVEGEADGTLQMKYIPQETPIEVGEVVLTSGLGGFIPKGLVIGQVTEVDKRDYALFQVATVRPAVDFSRLELALVITSFEQVPVEESPAEELPEATPEFTTE